MILWVLRDIPAAPHSSRPAGSIDEVRFDVRIDYTSQKPLQSSDLYTFRPQNLKYYKNSNEPFKALPKGILDRSSPSSPRGSPIDRVDSIEP